MDKKACNGILVIKQKHKKISAGEIKKLGYKFTDNQIRLGQKPYKFGILELKNEVGNREVSFCLLYSVDDKMGIILPNPYQYYVLRPGACYEFLK